MELNKVLLFFRNLLASLKSLDLSFSKLKLFEFCPKAYYLGYVKKLPRKKNPAINFGIAIHRVLENVYNTRRFELEYLFGELDRSMKEGDYLSYEEYREYKNSGEALLEKYFTDNFSDKENIPGTIAVEKWFSIHIGPNVIKGKIDRIDESKDGVYTVIDYKTHQVIPSKNELGEDLQMTIYKLATEKIYKPKKIRLQYYFLREGKIEETVREEEKVRKHIGEINDTARKIAFGHFEVHTKNCARCDYFASCDKKSFDTYTGIFKNLS